MNLTESFLTALDSLLSNKMRAVLTMLGVIIGVAAVIALMALGNGVNGFITGELTSIGTNLISITPDLDNGDGYPPLSNADAAALSDPRQAPAVAEVTALVQLQQAVVGNGNSRTGTVSGVTTNYFNVFNLDAFQAGDGLTEADMDGRARVAVLGATTAVDLFGDDYPVGQSIKIGGVSYEVVGVLESSGGGLLGSTDENVYIPITTAQSRLYTARTRSGQRAVNAITVQAVSEDQADAAVAQITEILRREHEIAYAAEDDFSILSQTDLLETFDVVTGTLTAFLGAIAGISLLVGGIGIMNIMLVSVTERTREIGIRKAVGALKRDILVQFLLESTLLSLLGGLLGIVLGGVIAGVAGRMLDLETAVDVGTVLMATGFAAAVGLVFGIYPAWRAAGLRSIEALRYE